MKPKTRRLPLKKNRLRSLAAVGRIASELAEQADKLGESERLLFVLERIADSCERIAARLDSWDGKTNEGKNWLEANITVEPGD